MRKPGACRCPFPCLPCGLQNARPVLGIGSARTTTSRSTPPVNSPEPACRMGRRHRKMLRQRLSAEWRGRLGVDYPGALPVGFNLSTLGATPNSSLGLRSTTNDAVVLRVLFHLWFLQCSL